MTSEPTVKRFDCVKRTREVRDRINEEIADLSGEELREWLSRRPTDPVLASLFDRSAVPEGREGGARVARGQEGSAPASVIHSRRGSRMKRDPDSRQASVSGSVPAGDEAVMIGLRS